MASPRRSSNRSNSFRSQIYRDDEEVSSMQRMQEDLSNNLLDHQEPIWVPHESIRVEAPTDLPGGYQMETEVEGHAVLVTVPKGGVSEGESFTPSAASLLSDVHLESTRGTNTKGDIPVGHWRDGFWDLCANGCCHAVPWNSCCCPLLAAGQMISRLQLTWYGTPASNVAQAALAFQIIVMILVGYICLRVFVFMTLAYLDPNADPESKYYHDPPAAYFFFAALDDFLFYIYFAFVVVLLRNIRSHLRLRYAIPEGNGRCTRCTDGCEDVCCSLFCPCFTVAQMLRHTADYDTYNAACCSSTGLRKTAPGIV